MLPFSDPEAVAHYVDGPVRQVPGFYGLQQMTRLLLAERIQDDAHVLVLGAGGGLELKAFAETEAGWRFCGVDPSVEMLGLAKRTLGPLASRVDFYEGTIDSAPFGPFDGATCLLTLHFLAENERRRTLSEVHRRLKLGAPFVVAHHSFPQDVEEKAKWLARYAAFAVASGVPIANAERAIAAISERLPTLSPEQDEALLREAGFADVALFYTAFTFRGWVAYKA
ncbi:methyltransferase [Gemmobacter aquaticus]|uniref:Methyltransferase n=1 Tax=Gemmobacter aquaticus TaxID=490185 RepID=A0A917YN73_9RHOB|nr:methyltransferase [Gemmobacter aquaticus]